MAQLTPKKTIILAPSRLRQDEFWETEVSLDYILSSETDHKVRSVLNPKQPQYNNKTL